MIELVYMSQAKRIFTEEELNTILVAARKNNTAAGVTGMLLYDGKGTFIQAIEGEPEDIYRLFNRIKEDSRHDHLQLLGEGEINERSFPEWNMGFKRLKNDDMVSVKGFSNLLELDADTVVKGKSGSFAVAMLNHFKQSIM